MTLPRTTSVVDTPATAPGYPWAPAAVIALVAVAAAGCPRPIGEFTWADDYSPPPEAEYRISPGDLLQVRVYKEDALSAKVRVRTDGKVSLPLLDDVPAAGRTPAALARELEALLKPMVNKPSVTVSLEETRGKQFSVIGEVARPGTYGLEPGLTLLQALANAGGIGEFANRDRIFVLRVHGADHARIRFTYDAVAHGEGKAGAFLLQPGDVIVVE